MLALEALLFLVVLLLLLLVRWWMRRSNGKKEEECVSINIETCAMAGKQHHHFTDLVGRLISTTTFSRAPGRTAEDDVIFFPLG